MEISEQKPAGLTGRYINALFELCSEKNNLNKVVSDLESIQNLIDNNMEVKSLISSPTIAKSNQTKALVNILKKANADNVTINFCGVVSENGRTYLLEKIIKEFLLEVSRRRGEINVDVLSAYELNEEEKNELKTIISKKIGDKKVSLVTQIDQSLIGGIVIKIGSKMIDNSIKTKLKNLELAMKGEG